MYLSFAPPPSGTELKFSGTTASSTVAPGSSTGQPCANSSSDPGSPTQRSTKSSRGASLVASLIGALLFEKGLTPCTLQQLRQEDELTHSVSLSRGRRTDPRTALLGLMDRLTVDLGGTLNNASLSTQSLDSTTPTQAHVLLLFGPSPISPKSLLSVHLNLPPSFDSSSGQASSTSTNTEKAFLRSLVNARSSCPLNPAKALPSKSKTFVLVRASRSFKKSGWMPKHGLEQTLAGVGRRIGWEGLHVKGQEGDGDHTERVSVEVLTTLENMQGVADSEKAASLGAEDGMWFVWEGGGLEGWTWPTFSP